MAYPGGLRWIGRTGSLTERVSTRDYSLPRSVGVCVCVFSSHLFWTSSSLDVPAGVTQEEGHTGFLIHLPSAVHALTFFARKIQPFLSLVDREVDFLCTNDFNRSPLVGHFVYLFGF